MLFRSVRRLVHETVRRLIDRMVSDMVAETRARAAAANPQSAAEVRAMDRALVAFSAPIATQVKALRQFLYENMYRHSRVSADAGQGAKIVGELFARYMEDSAALPAERQPVTGEATADRARRITDFIAGMTDRYAMLEHERLFHTPHPKLAVR